MNDEGLARWFGERPPNTDEVCALARQFPFDVWCANMSSETEGMSARKAYRILFVHMSSLWHGLRAEQPLVQPLAELYHGLAIFGPSPLEPMQPHLDALESARRLALLDAGRKLFKRRLIEGFAHLPAIGVRNLVIRWARIQYECVHAFQAPPRTTAEQAAQDAAGLSDHFAELMDEVLA